MGDPGGWLKVQGLHGQQQITFTFTGPVTPANVTAWNNMIKAFSQSPNAPRMLGVTVIAVDTFTLP